MGWTVQGSNADRDEIFPHPSRRALGSSGLLYSRYRDPFLGVKRSGRGVDHPPPSSTEVKESIEPYLYSPLSDFMACSRVKFIFSLKRQEQESGTGERNRLHNEEFYALYSSPNTVTVIRWAGHVAYFMPRGLLTFPAAVPKPMLV
jgi:hypothetical protein